MKFTIVEHRAAEPGQRPGLMLDILCDGSDSSGNLPPGWADIVLAELIGDKLAMPDSSVFYLGGIATDRMTGLSERERSELRATTLRVFPAVRPEVTGAPLDSGEPYGFHEIGAHMLATLQTLHTASLSPQPGSHS